MAARHGKFAEITINSKALTSFCDAHTLDITVDTAETSVYGIDWKTHLPGLAGATLSISGNYDPTAVTGIVIVLTALIGAAAFPVVVEPGGNTAGQIRHSFNALLTKYSQSAPVGGKITVSADVLVTGAVTTVGI
jgi:hypothetical protein